MFAHVWAHMCGRLVSGIFSIYVSHSWRHGLSVKCRDGRYFQSLSSACFQDTHSLPFEAGTYISSVDPNFGSPAFKASTITTNQSSQA